MNTGSQGCKLVACLELGGRCLPGAEIIVAPCLLPLAITHVHICLHRGKGHKWQLAVLWYFLVWNLLFCEHARVHYAVLKPHHRRGPVLNFCLWCCHVSCSYVNLAPSDCPWGIKSWSLPQVGWYNWASLPCTTQWWCTGKSECLCWSKLQLGVYSLSLFSYPIPQPILLSLAVPELPTDTSERGFPISENFYSFITPASRWFSIPKYFICLYVSYTFPKGQALF